MELQSIMEKTVTGASHTMTRKISFALSIHVENSKEDMLEVLLMYYFYNLLAVDLTTKTLIKMTSNSGYTFGSAQSKHGSHNVISGTRICIVFFAHKNLQTQYNSKLFE